MRQTNPEPIRQSPTLLAIADYTPLGCLVRYTGVAYKSGGDPASGEIKGAIEVVFRRPLAFMETEFISVTLRVPPETVDWIDNQTLLIFENLECEIAYIEDTIDYIDREYNGES